MAKSINHQEKSILKKWANILGYSGIIPFAGLAVMLVIVDVRLNISVAFALHLYGAIILSFLGGLHWGRIASQRDNTSSDKWYLIYSVIPSLIGWFSCLFVGIWRASASLLIAGFILSYLIDVRLIKQGEWQSWMGKLRFNLTLIACCSLTILLIH